VRYFGDYEIDGQATCHGQSKLDWQKGVVTGALVAIPVVIIVGFISTLKFVEYRLDKASIRNWSWRQWSSIILH